MPEDSGWYYLRDGRQHGPMSRDELRALIRSGKVDSLDYVWREGSKEWMPAVRVEGLVANPAGAPQTTPPPLPTTKHDLGTRIALPVGRSAWAIAAGYAGLFTLLIFPSPIALILGIIAVNHLRRKPHLYGRGRAWFGVVAGIVGTLLLLVALSSAALQS